MSAILLDQVVAHVRASFTRAEVADVLPYGGEFSAAEVGKLSYSCPAILLTVLGWRPPEGRTRMTGKHVRLVRMAAFVATKGASRTDRMMAAMRLAERLALVLRLWAPQGTAEPMEVAPIEADATCENLFGRAIDERGQALWLVSWQQCVRPTVPLPELVDLLAIDIDDTTRQGLVPAAGNPAPNTLVVTEAVGFAPLPPPA